MRRMPHQRGKRSVLRVEKRGETLMAKTQETQKKDNEERMNKYEDHIKGWFRKGIRRKQIYI